MAVKGSVWGTITNDEIRALADKLEAITLEESLDEYAEHDRQVWDVDGLRRLAAMRDILNQTTNNGK